MSRAADSRREWSMVVPSSCAIGGPMTVTTYLVTSDDLATTYALLLIAAGCFAAAWIVWCG